MERPQTIKTKTARAIVLPAVIAAMLLAGQVGLRFIPNVEIVTVIIMVSAFTFPFYVSIAAAFAFCAGQLLIYGFGTWVPAYFIYWPLLAAASLSLKLIKKPVVRTVAAVAAAVIFTTLFGVLTSAVDGLMIFGFSAEFLTYFPIVYMRGIYFYIVHIISNAIIVAVLFPLLSRALKRAGGFYHNPSNGSLGGSGGGG